MKKLKEVEGSRRRALSLSKNEKNPNLKRDVFANQDDDFASQNNNPGIENVPKSKNVPLNRSLPNANKISSSSPTKSVTIVDNPPPKFISKIQEDDLMSPRKRASSTSSLKKNSPPKYITNRFTRVGSTDSEFSEFSDDEFENPPQPLRKKTMSNLYDEKKTCYLFRTSI